MKVVPEDVFTVPLEGASREPQPTAVGRCLIKRHEIDDMHGQLYDLREQLGTVSHILLAIQVAVAVVTPGEIQYPLSQV